MNALNDTSWKQTYDGSSINRQILRHPLRVVDFPTSLSLPVVSLNATTPLHPKFDPAIER